MHFEPPHALNRRDLLKRSAGFALFPLLPNAVLGDVPEAQRFDAAWSRAANAGRPLVVVVIPEEQSHRRRNGTLMGMFLSEGSDSELAPLAIADLVCARVREISKRIPSVSSTQEPFLLVVFAKDPGAPSTDEPNFGVLRLDWANGEWGMHLDPTERITHEEYEARLAIAQSERRREIAALLRQQLDLAAAPLATRQRQNLTRYELEAIERSSPEKDDLTEQQARKAEAILLRRSALAEARERAWLEARLASIVRASFVQPSPEGAEWARPTGCGIRFESKRVNNVSGPCGMGSASLGERRFLYFLTEDRKPR